MSVLGNEAHAQLRLRLPQFYSRFTRDRLPPNHDLYRAARSALEQSLLSFASGLQATTDRSPSSFASALAYLRRGPRFESSESAAFGQTEAAWIAAFRALVADEARLNELDVINSDTARTLLSSAPHDGPRTVLHSAVQGWVERHLTGIPGWPREWQRCLDEGWVLSAKGEQRVTIYQAWYLHFREAIKHQGEVFNIFVATHLADLLDPAVVHGFNASALQAHLDERLSRLEQALQRLEQAVERIEVMGGQTLANTDQILQEIKQLRAAEAGRPFAELPTPPALFLGREPEVENLVQRLATSGDAGHLITAGLQGMGGIGKTALALAAGHAASMHFPGGTLFFALGAHSAAPQSGGAARRRWLEARLLPGERLAEHEADVGRLYLQRLAQAPGRVLVVVDDPAGESDLRPLWPRPGDALLVTARLPIAGLQPLALQALSPAAAYELLRHRSGRALTDGHAQALAEQCAHLPIALQAAAGFLSRRASKPTQEFIEELARERLQKLAQAAAGDAALDVSAVLGYSIRALADAERAALQALCVLPADFNRRIGAATADTEADTLDALVAAGVLVYRADAARFELHDLLREVAVATAEAQTLDAARLRHAHAVLDWVCACSADLNSREPGKPSQALRAFVEERSQLEHALRWLREQAAHGSILSSIVWEAADLAQLVVHPRDRLPWHEGAAQAAQFCGDRRAEAAHWQRVGGTNRELGDLAASELATLRALELHRALAEELGTPQAQLDMSFSLIHMGQVARARADWPAAETRYRESLELCRVVAHQLGSPEALRGVWNSLVELARAARMRGDWAAAEPLYRESLELSRVLAQALGTPEARRNVSISLENMGRVARALGDWAAADTLHRESLELRRALAQELGTPQARRDVGVSLCLLAERAHAIGLAPRVCEYLLEALPIFRELAALLGTELAKRELQALQALLKEARCSGARPNE